MRIGRLSEGAANDADPAGRNANLQWNYRGPSINNDVTVPTSQLIPTDQALKMIFDWFHQNGGANPDSPIVALIYGFTSLFLFPFTLVMLFPFLWMLVTSVETMAVVVSR